MLIEQVISEKILNSINSNGGEDSEKAKQKFADDISSIIIEAIKSATIVVAAGIPVQVVPMSGTGSTIAPATATIN